MSTLAGATSWTCNDADCLELSWPLIVLRPARMALPPRVGHPDFVGPIQPEARCRHGAIQFDDNGAAFFVIRKADWERKRDARILKMAGVVA